MKNVSIKNHVEWVNFIDNTKAENYTQDEYLSTNTNCFILETEHPGWKEYLNAFTELYEEKIEFPDRTQFSINPNQVPDKITSWVLRKVKHHMPYIDSIYPFESWACWDHGAASPGVSGRGDGRICRSAGSSELNCTLMLGHGHR